MILAKAYGNRLSASGLFETSKHGLIDSSKEGVQEPLDIVFDPTRVQQTAAFSFKKIHATFEWDTQIYSRNAQVGSAFLSFKTNRTTDHLMVGLNSDPTTDANYTSIDYAWYAEAAGIAYIYESGSNVNAIGYGAYTASTVFSIVYDGSNIIYYLDGVEKRRVATTANRTFYLDSSLYSPDKEVNNIVFSALNVKGMSAREFDEEAVRPYPAQSYYFPLDTDAKGYAPNKFLGDAEGRTVNPVSATNLAFDEDGCWVGTAVTNLWPLKSSHYTEEFPDTGMTYGMANVTTHNQAIITTDPNNDQLKTVTSSGTDPMILLSPLNGSAKGKWLIIDITVPAGATLDSSIGFFVSGSVAGAYDTVQNLSSLGMTALVPGQRQIRSVFLPTNSYAYSWVRLDVLGASGQSYILHNCYIGSAAYSDGTYYYNNHKGWVGDSTEGRRLGFKDLKRVSLVKAGGTLVDHKTLDANNKFAMTPGYYTVSSYYRQDSGVLTTPTKFCLSSAAVESTLGHDPASMVTVIPPAALQWQRGWGSADYDVTADARPWISWSASTAMELRTSGEMVERKPFVSAYCNSSRGAGLLTYNLYNACGLRWNADYTIVYWKKPHGTNSDGIADGYNLDSFGRNSNTVGGGYLWWGKTDADWSFGLSGSGATTSIDAWRYNWQMIAITRSGTTLNIRWYGMGTGGLVYSATKSDNVGGIANYYVNQNGYDFQLGGYDNANPNNSYFRDLLVIPDVAMSAIELDKYFLTKLKVYGDKVRCASLEEGIL
jgi:hypothetical protein